MKKISAIFICILLITLSGCTNNNKKDYKDNTPGFLDTIKVSKSAAKDITVYVTKTGECYHRSNCYTLKKSKIEKTLYDAARRYRPCSICNPREIEQ